MPAWDLPLTTSPRVRNGRTDRSDRATDTDLPTVHRGYYHHALLACLLAYDKASAIFSHAHTQTPLNTAPFRYYCCRLP